MNDAEKTEEYLGTDDNHELDKGIEDLDEFLSGLSPGITVVISRIEPAQFKGILEEIDITETSSPISLNYLIQQWGGHKLRLRFRKTSGRGGGRWVRHHDVPLYTYPPMIFGKPLKSADYNPHKGFLGASEDTPERHHMPPFPAEKKSDPRADFLEMAAFMSKVQESQLQLLTQLMKPQITPPINQMEQFGQMLAMFGQMRHMFQSPQSPVSPGGDGERDEVIGLLGQLAKGFFDNNKPAPPPPKLINGRQPLPVSETPMENPSFGDIPEESIIKRLSSMSPQDALSTFQNSVAAMPTDKRNETVAKLLETIDSVGGTDALLSVLEQKGIIGPEIDSEDETDTDNESAENSQSENTGGEL